MKKSALLTIISLLLVLQAPSRAEALLIAKFDVMAGEVSTAVTKITKQVQNVADKVMNSAIVTKIGKGFEEAKKWKETAEQKAKPFVDTYKDTQAAYDKVKTELIDSKLAQIKKLNDDISNIKERKNSLQEEIANVSNEIQSSVDSEISVIDGKINTIDLNTEVIKKAIELDPRKEKKAEFEAQLAQMESERESYVKQKEQIKANAEAQKKAATESLQSQVDSLNREIQTLLSDLGSLTESTDSTQDPEKALLYMRDTYFIKDNEKETPAKTEAVRVNRLLERRKSIVQVYQDAIELRHDIRNVDEDLEDQAYATTIYDTTGGAVGGDAEVRIRRMEALRRYARLLVADLKMKTANEVSLLTFTKLKKPQKTITEFNLDDYIFEMPEKSSEGSK